MKFQPNEKNLYFFILSTIFLKYQLKILKKQTEKIKKLFYLVEIPFYHSK